MDVTKIAGLLAEAGPRGQEKAVNLLKAAGVDKSKIAEAVSQVESAKAQADSEAARSNIQAMTIEEKDGKYGKFTAASVRLKKSARAREYHFTSLEESELLLAASKKAVELWKAQKSES